MARGDRSFPYKFAGAAEKSIGLVLYVPVLKPLKTAVNRLARWQIAQKGTLMYHV